MAEADKILVSGVEYRVVADRTNPVILGALTDYPWEVELLERSGNYYTYSAGLLLLDPRLDPAARARFLSPAEAEGAISRYLRFLVRIAPIALAIQLFGQAASTPRTVGLVLLGTAAVAQEWLIGRFGQSRWRMLLLTVAWAALAFSMLR